MNTTPDTFTLAERKAWNATTQYLKDKADELMALAYAGYTKQGKGVLIIGFSEGDNRGVPLMYVPASDLRGLRKILSSSTVKALDRYLSMYDPEQAACYCVMVSDGLTRTLLVQSVAPAKQVFARNAAQYLAQLESADNWLRKWG